MRRTTATPRCNFPWSEVTTSERLPGPVRYTPAHQPHGCSSGAFSSGASGTSAEVLRKQLVEFLAGRGAHMPFESAVASFPTTAINREPPNVPYTPWHLVEHIRRTQRDIIEYIGEPDHVSPPWPAGYWPPREEKTTAQGFAASVDAYERDVAELASIVRDPTVDLFAVLPRTPGHTVLREARLAADHTAYHVGEFAILRQVMGTWPAGRGR